MIRVVADTNVLISALLFGGTPGSFLDLALVKAIQLVTSPTLLDELDEKLRLKFSVPAADATLIRTKLEQEAQVIVPDVALSVIKDDPDDDRVLECAVSGKAEYIVSGDRHLLKLGSYASIEIVKVRQFLDFIETAM